ncbi:MAG: response regulator [Acidimicrobiales bacterium]
MRAVPNETEQIIVNLAINACDAMEGAGRLAVRLEGVDAAGGTAGALGLPAGSCAQHTVADDGPGMDPDVLARCIEPFFTTKELGRGSGLVVDRLRHRHRAGWDCPDPPRRGAGNGAEVWLSRIDEAPLDAPVDPAGGWDPARRLSGRVLVVEDEGPLRELATRALADVGLFVTAAADAEEAVAGLVGLEAVDAVVTEITLLGRSGVELAQGLRERWPDLPVVFMTGYAAVADRATEVVPGSRLGRKPFRPDELLGAVADLVGSAMGAW